MSDETKDILGKVETIADELVKWKEQADKEISTAGQTSKSTAEGIKSLEQKLAEMDVKVEKLSHPVEATPQRGKSIGEQFIESKVYKDMLSGGNYESGRFEVKEVVSSQAASAGDIIVPQRVPGIITPAEQPLRIRNLLAQGVTNSNAVEYVEETLFTNAAALAAESYEKNPTSKAESTLRFDAKTATVNTYAHWIPASRQAIADAGQLQAYINTRLTYGLQLVEDGVLADALINAAETYDDTILTGLGITENITRIDTIRAAILQARQAFYPASGIVINPADWAAIELAKGSDYRYIWVSVTDGGVARLWRVPVVESDSVTEGYFLVGAFRLGAQIWDREGVSIRVSEHHASYFIQNLVAILAEERFALTVYRPEAFVYGAFSSSSGS